METSALCGGPGRTWTAEELREKQQREGREWRAAQAAAALQAQIKHWIERGPGAIVMEIEADGNRRVFLEQDGRVMVRGRGTPEHLARAAQHHARTLRAILADRQAIEELVPAPEPVPPAAVAA
jgi:hypothetical protein